MIIEALRAAVMALAITAVLPTDPATAAVPWQDAEALRAETASIQRRLYRAPDPDLRREVAERLARVQSLWNARLAESYASAAAAQAQHIERALASFTQAVSVWDPAAAAAARAGIWTGLLDGAFRNTMAHLEVGEVDDAAGWLSIREYARTSRDTAASIAMREALAGRLAAGEARQVIERELLGIYAGEMRMAISQARTYLSEGYKVQLSGAIARAHGLHRLLQGNIATRLGSDPATAISDAFSQLSEPNSLPETVTGKLLEDLDAWLITYAPARLGDEELDRRVRLLSRFLKLVPLEYDKGVRDGEITVPFEYFEAGLFRDRAEMLFGELGYDLTARAPESFDRMADILAEMKQIIADKGDGRVVEELAGEADALIFSVYGSQAIQGGHEAALSMLPDILDEILLVAQAGDWAEAELKRLEAYALFDPDIEQRLMPRAPALALKMEAEFWEGSAAEPGLGRLIADRGPEDALKSALTRMKKEMTEIAAVLHTRLSTAGAFFQSLAILLREGLEAVLVLACMIGALKASGISAGGWRGWRWPVAAGVAAALAGSFTLWLAVGLLFSMTTLQRELLEGVTALTAAAVLLYVTNWVFRKAYVGDWVAEIRHRAAAAAAVRPGAGEKSAYLGWLTLFALAFLVVFREGFETVLFYEALLIDAPVLPVLGGLGAGAAMSAAAAYAVLGLGARLPMVGFFRVTGVMLAVLCVMLTGSGIRGLQTAALVPATPVSWFPDHPWLQLYAGLYPVAETLLAQGALAAILIASVVILVWHRSRASSTSIQQSI